MNRLEEDKKEGKKWRFTGNNFHPENGLETNDMGIFKRDPMGSLARELCQNSIDAKLPEEKCVRMEFQSFNIERSRIPDIDRLREEIESCYKYQKSEANKKALKRMLERIDVNTIRCLRISDYNTSGLTDVNSDEGSFYLITKGNGLSLKTGSTGGSKGVGKFASFVVSDFNTVFYSTKNKDGEEAYLGISKLCSTIYDEQTGEKTDGIGFYGINYKGNPINEQLKLEAGFSRNTTGTDVYILGFNDANLSWKSEIIMKILDSFMVAIARGELEVRVDDIEVNKDTVENIIEDSSLISSKKYESIKSQYILLTEEVSETTIEIDRYGTAEVKLKAYSKENAHLASYECVMVRYPHMKITTLKNITQVPFSAMCIIPDNKLNRILRLIENAQHTDWELARLNDDQAMKTEATRVKKELTNKICEYIQKVLSTSINEKSDIEGAGELLPSVEDNSGIGSQNEVIVTEMAQIVPKVKNKTIEKLPSQEDPNAYGETIDLVGEGNDVDVTTPSGHNEGGGGETHDGEERKAGENGDQEGIKLAPISGIKYRLMMPNKNNGQLILSFVSVQEAKNCELVLKHLDDSNNKYFTQINSCKINNQIATIKDGKVINFDLENNEKYKFVINTDLKDYYASEVTILYEIR